MLYTQPHFVSGNTMDYIWSTILHSLYESGDETRPRGQLIKEIRHFSFELKNPRNRIVTLPIRDFSLWYAVGELCWYLSGKNDLDFIKYYSKRWENFSDDGKTLNSAYGYRIFTDKHPLIPFNQWDNVKRQLKEDPDTRQAIIHLHTPNDKVTKDEVCTLCLQFFIRNGKLELSTTMRSNDAVWGTSYDVFTFTFLQEMMADQLDLELGSYYHHAGSIHIYEKHFEMAKEIANSKSLIDIDVQRTRFVNSEKNIKFLLEYEEIIRTSGDLDYNKVIDTVFYNMNMDLVWVDLVMILIMYRAYKEKNPKAFIHAKQCITDASHYSNILNSKLENIL